MTKIAIRLLMLSMLTASLLVVPVATEVSAATSNKHLKKKVRVGQQSPKAANPAAKSYSNNPYEDDEDRKRAAGGGGGY